MLKDKILGILMQFSKTLMLFIASAACWGEGGGIVFFFPGGAMQIIIEKHWYKITEKKHFFLIQKTCFHVFF